MANKKRQSVKPKKDKQPVKVKEKRDKKPIFQQGKKRPGIFMPNLNDEKTIGELKRTRVLTPFVVASKLNLKLSVAKDFLEELNEKGIVQKIYGDHRIKIYKPKK